MDDKWSESTLYIQKGFPELRKTTFLMVVNFNGWKCSNGLNNTNFFVVVSCLFIYLWNQVASEKFLRELTQQLLVWRERHE